MPPITRRTLLGSGLALSTASLLPGSLAGLTPEAELPPAHGNGIEEQAASVSQRERLLFDFDWKFQLGNGIDPLKDLRFGFGQSDFSKQGIIKFATPGYDDKSWRTLDLPHDWAVELPFEHDDAGTDDEPLRSHGYKPLGRRYPETSVGWYRREFDIPATDAGRRISVEFDGVFRDALVFVNGCFVGRNTNGYAPFAFDLSDFLIYGGRNCIVVRADATFGDGWFYEGAGIYRHVWLVKTAPVYLQRWETVVRATVHAGAANLSFETLVQNAGDKPVAAGLSWTVRDGKGAVVARAESPVQNVSTDGPVRFEASAKLARPELWSTETPSLYTATATVHGGGTAYDSETVRFGVRTVTFDAAKGFFLNGKSLKIQGTCNHQDHAGVGVALPDSLQTFRVDVLRGMGCNAVRTSHNMPTPEWVEACDRSGVMMMCETRQMSSSPEGMHQLETMIKRFRNSPSIILWSIGNEEYLLQDKMAEQGARIAASMVRRCHQLDPTRLVTSAVNFDNERGVSVPLDVIGFNYHAEFWENFHRKYPNRPVLGSEVSSAVSTRGEYFDDPSRNLVNSYDGKVGWGQTPEEWWSFYGTRDWEAGGFAWTGFDYRGEPTPYGWPSINSQFGIVDMCGFPKDYYFYYLAWWQPKPMLHLFPHWNWHGREGDEIPVWVYCNADEVELLVNGTSVGRQKVPHLGHVEWKVPYRSGGIEARSYRNGTLVLSEKRETTGKSHTLRLSADRTQLHADNQDAAVVRVEVLDSDGRVVPVAKDKIRFQVKGAGRFLGVGNGDPNCLESDKEPQRSAFNGLAQLIVQSTASPGSIEISAQLEHGPSHGTPVKLTVTTAAVSLRPKVA